MLFDAIHEFHDGDSRRIWGVYRRWKPHDLVARAVALGLLDRREVGAALLGKLAERIEIFEKVDEDGEE